MIIRLHMKVSYYETRDTINIVLYGCRSNGRGVKVDMLSEKIVRIGEKEITLLEPVRRILRISSDKYKIVVSLEKVKQERWGSLTESSQRGTKRIEKHYSQPEDEESQESDPRTMESLLTRLYEKSDNTTRMAMNKSFFMSKGTILSTDWKKVEAENYDCKGSL